MKTVKSPWLVKKEEVNNQLDVAGIDNIEIRRTILVLERRVMSLNNLLNTGASWQVVISTPAASDAISALSKLNGNGSPWCDVCKYYEEWKKYCDAYSVVNNVSYEYNTVYNSNLGDFLC